MIFSNTFFYRVIKIYFHTPTIMLRRFRLPFVFTQLRRRYGSENISPLLCASQNHKSLKPVIVRLGQALFV